VLRLCEKVSSIFSSSSVVAVDDVTVAAATAAAIVSMNASSPTFLVSFANFGYSTYFARDDCDLINLIKAKTVMNANAMVIFRVLLPLLLGLFACDMAAGYCVVPTGMNTTSPHSLLRSRVTSQRKPYTFDDQSAGEQQQRNKRWLVAAKWKRVGASFTRP